MNGPAPIQIQAPGTKIEGELLQNFRKEVAHLLGRKSLGFPGAQPVSFARKHLEELKRQDYYVCEKSDGLRYLLYCTNEGGQEVHYLIDRRNDFWWVQNLHFPLPGDDVTAFHTNTLIDGELVMDTNKQGRKEAKYLVFDCLYLDNKSLMSRTLDKRIAYFKENVMVPYRKLYDAYPEELDWVPFQVELKAMQFGYGIEMMFRQILPHLPHGNDGLIFTCRNTDYKHGTDQHILKWKPELENSIDFRFDLDFPVNQPDEIDRNDGVTAPWIDYDALPTVNLMVNESDSAENRWYATLFIELAEWEDMKRLGEPLDDRIAECFMDAKKRWRFMRWRDDKDKPNHISTVNSVIESITDAVGEKDLIHAAKGIRDEWKRRQAEQEERAKRGPRGPGPGMSSSNPSATGTNGMPVGTKRKAEEQGPGRPSPGPMSRSDQ